MEELLPIHEMGSLALSHFKKHHQEQGKEAESGSVDIASRTG